MMVAVTYQYHLPLRSMHCEAQQSLSCFAHDEKVADVNGVPRYVQFTMSTVLYSSQSFMVK